MFKTKYKIKLLAFITLLIGSLPWGEGWGGVSFAQNYPVQITTQIAPPFSGFIPDYSTPGNQNLKLLVLFTDFTKPSYNIKLKIQISGQGIDIRSKSYYYSQAITLQPGIPQEISGSDLSGLLNANNLDISGITTQHYQTQTLPEGYYNICVTAFDNNNPIPIQVSNQSCTLGWMVLSDPPFTNLPLCGSTIPAITPQNVMFQWTPMNMGSPNSFNNTLYDFELYEIRPGTQNPGNIIQTLPPIYQATTTFTFINYGITEPQLYYGMQYVWRVRARDQSGRDLFKNQGYSQQCTFTYGSLLSQIDTNNLKLTLQGTALTHRLAKYTWDSLGIFASYKLEYRKQGTNNWFPVNTTTPRNIVSNLEPENTYEARVKGLFSEGEGPWSNTVTITTPAQPVIVCGQGAIPPSAANFIPLKTGAVGQTWNIGQFDMIVAQLDNPNSPNGKYSGYGKIIVPFMMNMVLTGKFINITVNEVMVVVEGKVEITTSWQIGNGIINLDTLFGGIANLIDNIISELHSNTLDNSSLTNFNNSMTTLLASDSALMSLQLTYDSLHQHLLDISTTAGLGEPNYTEIQDVINELNELKGEILVTKGVNSDSYAASDDIGYFNHKIQPTDYAEYKNWISPGQDVSTAQINYGSYIITPSVNENNKIIYYSAFYKWTVSDAWFEANNIPHYGNIAYRSDWTIEPKEAKKFIQNINSWTATAAFLHNLGADYKLSSSTLQYLDGNYLEALKEQWKSAIKEPIFWLSLAHVSVSLIEPSTSLYSKTNFNKEITVAGKVKTVWNTPYKINNSRIRLLAGTNKNKIAIIGRKMDGHVKSLRDELQTKGINAEIFSKDVIPNETFLIEGEIKTWAQIENDFVTGNYARDPVTNFILEIDIPKTLMYKANKVWAEKLVNNGYHVYDAGYINNVYSKSLFYEMELKTIFNDGQ
ncbi:MAG: fibronectin type III domain-containing protein [Bacteroidia bacterium]|jgi:hypothetical protein